MHGSRMLITGVCGFTGRHLVELLRRSSTATIFGTDVAAEPTAPVDRYLACDLTNAADVDRLVRTSQPTTVFHLAGLMGSSSSEQVRRVNVGGFVCLSNALRQLAEDLGRPIRMLTIGSAAEVTNSDLTANGFSSPPPPPQASARDSREIDKIERETTNALIMLAIIAQGPLSHD